MNPTQAKLLIVDGNGSMREALRALMLSLGILNIETAPDGGTALALLRSNHYDVLLADWNIELLRTIRQGLRVETAVVLLSGDVSLRNTLAALEAGANGLVEKPFNPKTLGQKVLRILASHAGPLDRSLVSRAEARTREFRPDLLS